VAIDERARVGFSRAAAEYERGRPGYPAAAVRWLADRLELRPGRTVVDIGAGTGKLTRELLRTGVEVIAAEPVQAMRAVLEQAVPGIAVLDAPAEALPLPAASADAIVVASAFHWFDGDAALAEFHRVLRSRGRLALLWNRRRHEERLHQEIDAIIESLRRDTPSYRSGAWRTVMDRSELFAQIGEETMPNEQRLTAEELVDRITSISFVGAEAEARRGEVATRVRELAATAPEPLILGYDTELFLYEAIAAGPASQGASTAAIPSRSSPAPRQASSAIRAATGERNGAHTAPLERTSASAPSNP
jgi:SAM-dependent methyltransferase